MKIPFLLIFIVACSLGYAQTKSHEYQKKNSVQSVQTPHIDSLEKWTSVSVQGLSVVQKNEFIPYDLYLLNDQLFTGWASEEFPETDHKYRYSKYEKGIMVRQIAYYASKKLDADFHMKAGKNVGSQQLWYGDGSLFSTINYSSAGELDGLQWQWHPNGTIARKSMYTKGTLISELLYDLQGNPILSGDTISE